MDAPLHSLHSPFLPDIQTSFLFFFEQSFTLSIHLFRSQPTERLSAHPYIYPLSNPIIFHSLHTAEPQENTFIDPFITPHNSHIYAFGNLSTFLIPSKPFEVVHLYSLNLGSLLLLPYLCFTIIREIKHEQCLVQDHSAL